jgi:hypothetical protein
MIVRIHEAIEQVKLSFLPPCSHKYPHRIRSLVRKGFTRRFHEPRHDNTNYNPIQLLKAQSHKHGRSTPARVLPCRRPHLRVLLKELPNEPGEVAPHPVAAIPRAAHNLYPQALSQNRPLIQRHSVRMVADITQREIARSCRLNVYLQPRPPPRISLAARSTSAAGDRSSSGSARRTPGRSRPRGRRCRT